MSQRPARLAIGAASAYIRRPGHRKEGGHPPPAIHRSIIAKTAMANLDEIYNTRILELAGAISHTDRLADPDGTATGHSKLCGSTVTVDVKLEDGRVSDFGQSVKACLLGQASASVMAREIVGSTPDELRQVGQQMRAMLKEGGPPPTGRWADLGVLEPVRNYKARQASTLLVFDAVEKAVEDALVRRGAALQLSR
jgi:NifU-like protein involved in Fe-S cluster formation